MTTPALEEYLTSEQTAEVLGYTVQHVRRLVREGRLAGRKLGRDWLLLRTSVDRFLAQRATGKLPLGNPGAP